MRVKIHCLRLLLFTVLFAIVGLSHAKPNIVIIMADNLGYGDIGVYGSLKVPTPRIDQLARSGIQFRDFQVEPACSPARAAIMTGRMAVRSGTDAVLEPGVPGGLDPREITLAEMLRDAGYKTAHYGKWHLGFAHERQPQMQGFDDFWGILFTSAPGDPEDSNFDAIGIPTQKVLEARRGEKARVAAELTLDYRGLIDTEITDRAVSYIETNAGGKQPFFLYVPFINPHNPVVAHPNFVGKSGGGAYCDALMELDYHTGRILDAIEAEDIAENTIVIWLSDNGPQRYALEPYHSGDPGPWTGELGSVFEGGLRTVGMINWPGTIEPHVSDELFHSMDLFSTLATWAGAKVPGDRPIDSLDQSEYLLNPEVGSKRKYVMVYYNGEFAAMRYLHFKLMRAVYPRRNSLMSEAMYLKSIPRIYNLRADPKEHYIVSGGMEALARSLVLKEAELRKKYRASFAEFPNAKYDYMSR